MSRNGRNRVRGVRDIIAAGEGSPASACSQPRPQLSLPCRYSSFLFIVFKAITHGSPPTLRALADISPLGEGGGGSSTAKADCSHRKPDRDRHSYKAPNHTPGEEILSMAQAMASMLPPGARELDALEAAYRQLVGSGHNPEAALSEAGPEVYASGTAPATTAALTAAEAAARGASAAGGSTVSSGSEAIVAGALESANRAGLGEGNDGRGILSDAYDAYPTSTQGAVQPDVKGRGGSNPGTLGRGFYKRTPPPAVVAAWALKAVCPSRDHFTSPRAVGFSYGDEPNSQLRGLEPILVPPPSATTDATLAIRPSYSPPPAAAATQAAAMPAPITTPTAAPSVEDVKARLTRLSPRATPILATSAGPTDQYAFRPMAARPGRQSALPAAAIAMQMAMLREPSRLAQVQQFYRDVAASPRPARSPRVPHPPSGPPTHTHTGARRPRPASARRQQPVDAHPTHIHQLHVRCHDA